MKFLKSKFFIICAICVAILVLVGALLSALGYSGPIRGVFKTVAKPFEFVGSKAADAVNGFVTAFTERDRLVAENEALKEAIAAMEKETYDSELLRQENAWLKEYLKIAQDNPSFILEDARIVSRESGSYATVLTLDKGTIQGIKKNMPVITENGVFGYVKEVGLDWCKIVSIIETASSVGAYTDRAGAIGIVSGDVDLRGGGVCRMTYIDKSADIRIGDKVYTSGGTGSIYPSGLLIGEIVSIEADETGLTVSVQPAVDFSDIDSLSRVMVICGYDT